MAGVNGDAYVHRDSAPDTSHAARHPKKASKATNKAARVATSTVPNLDNLPSARNPYPASRIPVLKQRISESPPDPNLARKTSQTVSQRSPLNASIHVEEVPGTNTNRARIKVGDIQYEVWPDSPIDEQSWQNYVQHQLQHLFLDLHKQQKLPAKFDLEFQQDELTLVDSDQHVDTYSSQEINNYSDHYEKLMQLLKAEYSSAKELIAGDDGSDQSQAIPPVVLHVQKVPPKGQGTHTSASHSKKKKHHRRKK